MTKLTIWDPNIGDRPAQLALTNNLAATAAPTVNDDSTKGYEPGSQWVYNGQGYLCVDSTPGAAVWAGDASGENLIPQGTPVAHNTAATLTAADMLAGIITSAPSGGAINLQLPLATAMDTALPDSADDQAFDFSIINTDGTNAATVTTNTGWTALVGAMAVAHNTSGRFRARKTAAGAWTLYRIS